MSDRKNVVQRTCLVMVTMFVATSRDTDAAVVLNAAVDVAGEHGDLLQMLFKQIDMVVNTEQRDSKTISSVDSAVASTLLQVAPSVTVKGNITDPDRRLTLTFIIHAARSPGSFPELSEDDDDEEDDEWRSSSGVLTPLVDVVEPYVMGFVELVVNGILSTVISNFLEGGSLLGDVRLV